MRLRSKQDRDIILDLIHKQYPDKTIELDFETPFQLLLAVMFSAQMTDKGVNKATPELFSYVREPQDMMDFSVEEVAGLIKSINYYNTKARHAVETAIILVEKFEGKIPDNIPDLTSLPGVGIKTAKVVLAHLYDAPFIGVDTHIHRVSNRMGIVKTTSPDQTDKKLETCLTIEQKKKMHHAMVLYGRYVCTTKDCKCPGTPLEEWCQCEQCQQ